MKKTTLYIILSAILFSTMEVALKIAATGMSAFQLTFLRFLIGGIVLLPFAISKMKKNKIKMELKDFLAISVLGIFLVCISMSFFQFSVQFASAGTSSVLFCTNPMFTMVLAHFLVNEKMNKNKVIAITICAVGILFMINPFKASAENSAVGILCSLMAAFTFGIYTVASKPIVKKIGGVVQTSIGFIIGAAVLGVAMAVFKEPIFAGITMKNIGVLMYTGVFVTGIGYLIYFMIIEEADATTAAIVFFVKPAIAPFFAVVILNETLQINNILGIVLILFGSAVNMYANSKNGKATKKINIQQHQK